MISVVHLDNFRLTLMTIITLDIPLTIYFSLILSSRLDFVQLLWLANVLPLPFNFSILFTVTFQPIMLMILVVVTHLNELQIPFMPLSHFLGIDSATEKDCPPSTLMVFLGSLFNTVAMTMSIPQEKLSELLQVILHISHADRITRHSLQSLLGLMSYVTACVHPARIFMAARLNGLCGLPCHATLPTTDDIRAELEWWLHFLPKYNGISIIPPPVYDPHIVVIYACLTGGGGGHLG